MFEITAALKAFLVGKGWANADASDDAFRKAVKDHLGEGDFTPAKLVELTESKTPKPGEGTIKKWIEDAVKEATGTGTGGHRPTGPDPSKAFGGGSSGWRVKDQGEAYDRTKHTAKHAKYGHEVTFQERPVLLPSQYEKAKAGALLRLQAIKAGIACRPLNEHEKGLLEEAYRDRWHGEIGGEWYELSGEDVKALLDDSASGGIHVTPEWLDESIITYPLLHGELFPYVDVRDMPRGRNIETAGIATPSVGWGTAEGTAITPFTTTGLIDEITSSVFPVQVAVEVGRDLMSDASVDVGAELVRLIGERMMNELDKVIATGDGTTQPQGLTNASGVTAVNSDNGTGGPITVGDLEGLIFAVPKQYRVPAWNPAIICNDVTYSRMRGIPVSGTDQRRVFGMSHSDYRVLENPVRISNDLGNSTAIAMPLKKYRMWRRQGSEVRWTQEGNYLALRNLALLTVRARYGGKVIDSNAVAKMTDLPS